MTSMETDAQSYTGVPFAPAPTAVFDPDNRNRAAKQVLQYRNALSEAAQQGKLSDETGTELASRYLGLAAASVSATALIMLERHLHAARESALGWSNGTTDQSSQVIILEHLADDATERIKTDLLIITD